MTTPAVHCYCHASRFARRVLRRRLGRAVGSGLWGLVALLALCPAKVGGGATLPPLMELEQAQEPVPTPAAAVVAALVDPLPILVSALGDCPNALSLQQRWRIARIINQQSVKHGYDPLFITALVQVESGCSPTARGGDALGLVQMLPSTARGVAQRLGIPWRGERTLTEPSSSIQLGLHYLIELEEQLGDPYRAVAAYNLGPARVARMSSGRAQRTQYVRKILSLYERLLDLYA